MQKQTFKTCPMCMEKWDTRDSFLEDPNLMFNGYQPDFEILEQGFFYFTHQKSCCGSTMTLGVDNFISLSSLLQRKEPKTGSALCCCDNQIQIDNCQENCKNSIEREVSQLIQNRLRNQ